MKSYLFLFLIICSQPANGQEMAITKNNLPASVLQTFRTSYPNARITGARKKVEKGVTSYEVSCSENSIKKDIGFTAEGKLAKTKEEITIDKLPEPVANVIAKRYAKGKILKIEKTVQDVKIEYEVLIRDKKKKSEIVFLPNGSIVSKK